MRESLKRVNLRLFIALFFMGLVPVLYTTFRTNLLGQLPGDYSYSIAGQLSWVNLLYEIVDEAIILPLFFFLGETIENKKEFSNRVKTGLILTGSVYVIFSSLICIFVRPLLIGMAASSDIIEASVSYIRIESIANIFGILYQFALVALVTIGKQKFVYALTGLKLILCITFDTFFVSTLPISLQLGVNGIGVSNILANLLLLIFSLYLLKKNECDVFVKDKMEFSWMQNFGKVGGISGLESFIRNIAYILMVSRMVNMVSEQGTYWVANNFIWGWLLLPVNALGELIKQEVSTDKQAIKNNTKGYFGITGIICVVWFLFIPLYKPFMQNILGYADVDKLFNLVMMVIGFYILYAFQNVFDQTFYGVGRTDLMLWESVISNSVYYGTFFILYLTKIWTPTLTSIAIMFGAGNAFDSIVSGLVYWKFRKKLKI